jgi:hypothetical protein
MLCAPRGTITTTSARSVPHVFIMSKDSLTKEAIRESSSGIALRRGGPWSPVVDWLNRSEGQLERELQHSGIAR